MPRTLVFTQATSARGLCFKPAAGTGATCLFPPIPAGTVSDLSDVLGQIWQLSQVWIGRLHPFPGIILPTQAPSFQMNYGTIFSNAGASRGHLTVMLVGQGITLRCSRNHHLVPTALSRENALHCCLPAGNKSKPPASRINLPDKTNCNMKEISQANSLCSRRKQPKAQMKSTALTLYTDHWKTSKYDEDS